MTQLVPPASAIAAPTVAARARGTEDRLPMGQSVLLILGLSLGLWTALGLVVRWAIG
jgi:hypothetical protein